MKLTEPTENRAPRFFQAALGLAVLAVLAGYLGIDWITRILNTFQVPLFFVSIGCLADPSISLKELLAKVLRCLGIPYLCFAILLGMILWMQGNAPGQILLAMAYGSGTGLESPLEIPSIGSLWIVLAAAWEILLLRGIFLFRPLVQNLAVFGLFALSLLSSRLLFWFPLDLQAGMVALFYGYTGYQLFHGLSLFEQARLEIRLVLAAVCLVVWLAFIEDPGGFFLVNNTLARGFLDVMASLCALFWIFAGLVLVSRHLSWMERGLLSLGQIWPWTLGLGVLERQAGLLEGAFASVPGGMIMAGILRILLVFLAAWLWQRLTFQPDGTKKAAGA